jgi:predicted transcriptional regulator
MSPFSHFLHTLRMRLEIRQAELAALVGYEQSYISALEVGLKGPPTEETSRA